MIKSLYNLHAIRILLEKRGFQFYSQTDKWICFIKKYPNQINRLDLVYSKLDGWSFRGQFAKSKGLLNPNQKVQNWQREELGDFVIELYESDFEPLKIF